jgi:hypothetical protein
VDVRDFIMGVAVDVAVGVDVAVDVGAGYMYVTAPFWIFAYIYN